MKGTSRETRRANDQIKRHKIGRNNLKCGRKDPILVFDLFYRFVAEADMPGMSGAQAFVALPNFWSGFDQQQYRAVRGSLTADAGVTSSSNEAGQYLL